VTLGSAFDAENVRVSSEGEEAEAGRKVAIAGPQAFSSARIDAARPWRHSKGLRIHDAGLRQR
jgi:hypothetical protein